MVVLTQGTRPDDLAVGLASVIAQRQVVVDVVVVGNGWVPSGLPEHVASVALSDNLGIPAGRNSGVAQVSGDWLFFLDDDASIPDENFLADAISKMTVDPSIGMIQPRVVDPTGAENPRRWTPRIRKGDPLHSSVMFTAWEGAIVMPRRVFDATGGWAEPFFYAHEGIELVWRVWDQGLRAWYAGDLMAHHPAIEPTRHSYYYRLNARNRVWLARRNLPAVLVPVYVGSWTAIQVLRWARCPAALSAWFSGWRAGWRESPGERRPMSWRTVGRMTRAGRPPIV